MHDRSEGETFAELMQQLREGSEDAARRILEDYGEYIYRAVRRRLNRQLRSKFDSQDFVQSVWASFFANLEQIREFRDADDFIRYLARMAANKVIEETRRRLRGRRNVNRELRLISQTNDEDPIYISGDPTPSEVLMAREQFAHLAGERDTVDQRVVSMRADRKTFREIAEQMNLSERTARRVVARLLRRMGREGGKEPG